MNYWDNLNFLQRGLGAGAISGEDALSSLMELDQARAEARRARKQAAAEAQMGSLDFLRDQSLSAAGTPSTMEDVMRLTQANAMFDQGNPTGALDSLFLPEGSQYEGNWGQSRISPTLLPEDVEAVQNALAAQTPTDMILDTLRERYGPKTFQRLLPDIQKLFP